MTRATTMQAASEVRFNRFLAGVYLVMALGLAVTALALYLDFINLFLLLFASRR